MTATRIEHCKCGDCLSREQPTAAIVMHASVIIAGVRRYRLNKCANLKLFTSVKVLNFLFFFFFHPLYYQFCGGFFLFSGPRPSITIVEVYATDIVLPTATVKFHPRNIRPYVFTPPS